MRLPAVLQRALQLQEIIPPKPTVGDNIPQQNAEEQEFIKTIIRIRIEYQVTVTAIGVWVQRVAKRVYQNLMNPVAEVVLFGEPAIH